ncbi:MAG: hypothetical protein RL693_1895, partial [Verrucomicrobiota bacterium]
MHRPPLFLAATALFLTGTVVHAEDYTSYTEPNRSIDIS